MHLVGLLSSYFAHDARSQEPKPKTTKLSHSSTISHVLNSRYFILSRQEIESFVVKYLTLKCSVHDKAAAVYWPNQHIFIVQCDITYEFVNNWTMPDVAATPNSGSNFTLSLTLNSVSTEGWTYGRLVGVSRYNRRSHRIQGVPEAGPTILGFAHPLVVFCYFLFCLFACGGGLCPDCVIRARSRVVCEPS
jgi:hypothetical protein